MESWQRFPTTVPEMVGHLFPEGEERNGRCGRYSTIPLSGLPRVPCLRQDLSVDLCILLGCSILT